MAVAMEEILGDWLETGIIVTKDGYAAPVGRTAQRQLQRTRIYESGHPIPDIRGIKAAQEISTLLQSLGNDDLVIFMISGGGSALLNSPVSGVSLADLQQFTDLLLRSGATINQLNTLRKHLDLVKGGGLARLAYPAVMVTLVLSDVIGDPLDSNRLRSDCARHLHLSGGLVDYRAARSRTLISLHPIRNYLDRGRHGEVPETLETRQPGFRSDATGDYRQ